MWHFALDVKDASGLNGTELKNNGITHDFGFGQKTIETFKAEHPRWNDRESDDYGEVDFLQDLVFFKVDAPEPADASHAAQFVTEHCFWAPMLITHGGKLLSMVEYGDDTQVRISVPG